MHTHGHVTLAFEHLRSARGAWLLCYSIKAVDKTAFTANLCFAGFAVNKKRP